jgi:hypothetical protein
MAMSEAYGPATLLASASAVSSVRNERAGSADSMYDMMNERRRIYNGEAGLQTAEVHSAARNDSSSTQVEINVECLSVQFHIVSLLQEHRLLYLLVF